MIQPVTLIKLLLALIMTLAATAAARAQEGPRGMWPDTPESLIRDAVSTPYADALLKQFAANVRKSGDPACLQAKGLDDTALIARGRALWQTRGMQMLTTLERIYNRQAYNAALSEAAGRKAAGEIERLRRDPEVKRFINSRVRSSLQMRSTPSSKNSIATS